MRRGTKPLIEADPKLKVVEAKHHTKPKKTQAEINWEKAQGEFCDNCGSECFRIVNSGDKRLCLRCLALDELSPPDENLYQEHTRIEHAKKTVVWYRHKETGDYLVKTFPKV